MELMNCHTVALLAGEAKKKTIFLTPEIRPPASSLIAADSLC
jgi:hypothetical protein